MSKAKMQQLTGSEVSEFVSGRCIEIATDSSGWVSLFQERATNTYWVRSYPDSSQHGGGQPVLTQVSAAEAKEKFDV